MLYVTKSHNYYILSHILEYMKIERPIQQYRKRN